MAHKNILITGGSLQADSRGIEAIVLGTIASIQNANSDVSFTALSGRCSLNQVSNIEIDIGGGKYIKEYKITGFHIPALLIKSILNSVLPNRVRKYVLDSDPVMAAFAQADAIVSLSAGDSFSDIYGYRQFLPHYLFDLVAITLRRPLIIFPQTIGPFDKYLSRVLARFSLCRAKLVFTRESFSTETVRKLCGNSASVLEKIDMAFLMQPTENNGPKLTRVRPRIGLNISGFMCSPRVKNLIKDFDYIQFMKEVVKIFVEKYDTDVLLVPHDYSLNAKIDDDLRACETLYESLENSYYERVTIVRDHYRAPKLKAIIGECDFFVGARLHACIAALSMKVPAIPIAYSYKFRGILQKIGIDDIVCDPNQESVDSMLLRIQESFEKRELLRLQLEKKLSEIQEATLSCGDILNNLI